MELEQIRDLGVCLDYIPGMDRKVFLVTDEEQTYLAVENLKKCRYGDEELDSEDIDLTPLEGIQIIYTWSKMYFTNLILMSSVTELSVCFEVDVNLLSRTINLKVDDKYDFGTVFHNIPHKVMPCVGGTKGCAWECFLEIVDA